MNNQQATMLVALLQAAYPGREMPPSTVRLYAQELAPYDFDRAQPAIRQLIRTSRYLPTIAEVLSVIREREPVFRPALPPSPEERERRREAAMAAFAEIHRRLDGRVPGFLREGEPA